MPRSTRAPAPSRGSPPPDMDAQTQPPQQTRPSPAQAAAMAAAARPTRLTGRAALLAVVICAIALSLAYPVREYIAQRQQIDQLLALQQANAAQVRALEQENGRLTQTWYVEQQAEDELHMCFPQEQCYEVVPGRSTPTAASKPHVVANPWYATLWQSVQRADAQPAK
jgi:cell division protein FtsB